MPTISMFYGIIIRMYFAPSEHPPPHFHVYYAEYKATVDIRTCEIIESDLPKKQKRLVVAWAELHQEELLANWKLVPYILILAQKNKNLMKGTWVAGFPR